jgi:hypothetical protein
MFDLLSDWIKRRPNWTPENIHRLGFEVAPVEGSDQGIDPLSFRMALESIRIRDLLLFRITPSIKTTRCQAFRHDLAKFLCQELLSHPNDETLFKMSYHFFGSNPECLYQLFGLLKQLSANLKFQLVILILRSFEIPIETRRNLLHFPFDQSVMVKTEAERAIYRELFTLLDPEFEIPRWLLPT